jgi:hypothetical protein
MGTATAGRGRIDRALRSMCRCDGLKDVAVIAALLAVSGALVLRLAAADGGAGHHPRLEHRSTAPALAVWT